MPAAPAHDPHYAAIQAGLMRDYSIEMTAKDIEQLPEAAGLLPQGTQVSITFLPNDNPAGRVDAAEAVRAVGLVPVPHISARRINSQRELEGFLDALAARAQIDRVFVIAGDPQQPEGPYIDALAVISSGLLTKYGIKRVGIAGYPEGHPNIAQPVLWEALRAKCDILGDLGLDGEIVTQFGFDADPIAAWLRSTRKLGVTLPVRLGVAGPASVKTLLLFAARCGVGASAKVMSKYGLSLTRLLGTAGPNPLIDELESVLDPAIHGETKLHFYPFGGLTKTAEWARTFRTRPV